MEMLDEATEYEKLYKVLDTARRHIYEIRAESDELKRAAESYEKLYVDALNREKMLWMIIEGMITQGVIVSDVRKIDAACKNRDIPGLLKILEDEE